MENLKIKSYYLTIGLVLLAIVISLVVTLSQQGTINFESQDVKIVEHTISQTKKVVDVSIPRGSKNVLIETELPSPVKTKNAQVKWVNQNKIIPKEDLIFIDEDKDGMFEKIAWNVPGGIDESFEIDLLILNPIEYLKDGDLWQVRFTTVGTADLSIWSENSAFEEIKMDLSETIDEMEFLNLSCGSESLKDRLIVIDINNNSYKYSNISESDNIKPYKFVIEDYSCDEIGNFNNYMNIGGYAVLQFEFANEIYTIRDEAVDPSVNESRNDSFGYEFLDMDGNITNASVGDILHMWNTQDDYFFNKTSGIQLTNHFQDYWTRNIFCIGYYSGTQWNVIKCADEIPEFNRMIETDNSTYINVTLWHDFTYGGYDFRFGVRYHLKPNDQNLSVVIHGRNMDTVDIPFPLGFAWRITDWEIPVNIGDDDIFINNTNYPLNGTYDLMFRNMTKILEGREENISRTIPFFMGHDDSEFLRVDWNENLNYSVQMLGDGAQENFSVTLLINAGLFSAGQEKSTIIKWIDAELFLQDANTEVLDDDDLYYDGDQTYLVVDDEEGASPPYGYAYVKFNISDLNTSLTIDYAEFCYVVRSADMGGSEEEILEVYGVSNYTWVEEDSGGGSTKSLINSQGTLIFEQSNPGSGVGTTYCLNVSDWVRNETRDGMQNITIGLNLTESSEDISDDYFTFYSKEYTDVVADRPYLNVTYEFSSEASLTIIDPTTSSPESVSAFDNITVKFNFTSDGTNQTSGVSMDTVLIGGEDAIIVSGQAISDTNSKDCDSIWGFDCGATCTSEQDNTFDGCTSCENTDERINNVYLNSTSIGPSEAISVICEYYTTETTADEIYIYYRNSSSGTWQQKASGSGSGSGSTVRNFTTLSLIPDNVIGTHQVRCSIDYTGEGDECSTGSVYYDHDDINFSVIVATTEEFGFYDASWNVNVTVPSGLSGYQDLFVNATYSGDTRNDIQTNAINYGGAASTLIIINPTTSSPESVSAYDNITLSFNFTSGGTNQTSGVTIDTVLIGGENATIVTTGGVSTAYPINFTGFEADSTSPWDGWVDGGTGVDRASSLADYCSDTACPDTGTYSIVIADDAATSELSQTFNFATACGGSQCDEVIFSGYLYPNSFEANEGFSLVCDWGGGSQTVIDTWEETGGDTICGYTMTDDSTWNFFSCNLSVVGCTLDSSTKISVIGGQLTAPDETIGDRIYMDGLNVTGYAGGGGSQEFAYYNASWNVNVTMPSGLSGSQDLFLNATYSGDTRSDTETSAISYGGNPLSGCATISTHGNYILTDNVTSSTTCFTITADNVTLNCNNYWIEYSTGGVSGYGVHADGYENTTLKNCYIYDGTRSGGGASRQGIYLDYADYALILNNFVNTSNGRGIYIDYGSGYANISNNRVYSNSERAIYENGGAHNGYYYNNTAVSVTGVTEDGMSLWGDNLILIGNNATGRNGMRLPGENITLINNIARATGSNEGGMTTTAENSTFIGNTFYGGTRAGMNLYSGVDNSIFINNTVYSVDSRAILVSLTSNNNTFINNTAYSTNSDAVYIYGYYNNFTGNTLTGGDDGVVVDGASGNIFSNNTIVGTADNGVEVRFLSLDNIFIGNSVTAGDQGYRSSNANGTLISDCVYTSGTNYDMFITDSSRGTIITNCSYDISKEYVSSSGTGSNLTRRWYFDGNVSNVARSPLQNANMSVHNGTFEYIYTDLSDSNGDIDRTILVEYVNLGGTRTYYGNYTANTTLAGYNSNSTSYNLTIEGNVFNEVIMVQPDDSIPLSDCGVISTHGDYILTDNVTNAGTCFTITAVNVTLNCADYWIEYSTTDTNNRYGIHTNQDNTTIENCNVYDGTRSSSNTARYGIFLDGSDGAILFNNFVNTSTSHAIRVFWQVSNINLTRNIGFSDSRAGIYASSEYSYFLHNNATSGSNFGFDIGDSSRHNTFVGNNGTSTTNSGIMLFNSYNNTLINNTGISGDDWGIEIDGSENNTIIGLTVRGLSGGFARGINLDESKNNFFQDCIEVTGAQYDVYINGAAGSSNNTFLNCSYDIGGEYIAGSAGNEIIRKWWFDGNVSNVARSPLVGANMSVHNGTFEYIYTDLSDSNGDIVRTTLTEYINVDDSRTYYENYTANTILAGYETNSTSYNLTIEGNVFNEVIMVSEGDFTPQIIWEDPTPSDGETIPENFAMLNTTINYPSNSGNTSAWFDWNKSLLGYWSFDYVNSTHVLDNSTYNNLASFGGSGFGTGSITTGVRGDSLEFDGNDDYLNISSFDLSGTDEMTISFWLKYTTTDETIIEHSENFNDGNAFEIFLGEFAPAGGLEFVDTDSTPSSGYNVVYTSNTYNDGEWHNFIITVDRGAGSAQSTIYVDGVSDTIQHGTYDTDINENFGNNNLYMSGRAGGSSFLDGSLDEVLIFDRVLNDQEILALYNNSANRLYTNITNLGYGDYNYTAYAIDGDGNFAVDDDREVTVDYSAALYSLDIVSPLTLTPKIVVEGDNITVSFNYSVDGVNQTSGVTMENVTIGGKDAAIWMTLNPTNTTERYCSSVWGFDCGSYSEADNTFDSCVSILNNGGDNDEIITNLRINVTTAYSGDEILVSCMKTGGWPNDDQQVAYRNSTTAEWQQIQTWTASWTDDTWYTTTITVDDVIGEHQVRCSVTDMEFSGTLGTCVGGDYFDNDDINFTVITETTEEFAYYDSSWNVNVTAPAGLSGLQDLFVNATYSGITRNDIEIDAIDYIGASCIYSGSGNWEMDCNDNCTISSPVQIDGSNISIIGNGHTVILANITGFQNIRVNGLTGHCRVTCANGGCFQT